MSSVGRVKSSSGWTPSVLMMESELGIYSYRLSTEDEAKLKSW